MTKTLFQSFPKIFLGNVPLWYKQLIIFFLIINPIIWNANETVAGWVLVIEFIITLALALKAYPLQPGGLLVIEALLIHMTTPESVWHEIEHNLPVIMLLLFMVAGIYFMQDILRYLFTKLLLGVKKKISLAFAFCLTAAVLSAFLDALTVTAVIITVSLAFYGIYHKVESGKHFDDGHDMTDENAIRSGAPLPQFRSFLRSLLMHAAVGTAIGGVCTLVGEPQNLLIGHLAEWHFGEFALRMTPVTIPVVITGLVTCLLLEKFKLMDYGATMPIEVRNILEDYRQYQEDKMTQRDWAALWVQAAGGILLTLALAFHVAEVGLIGLGLIIFITALTGKVEEHQIGHAFVEGGPFLGLIVVFFAVVAVIHDLHLFTPVINWVLTLDTDIQPGMFFIANGLLSAVSDNVFVASIYATEVQTLYEAGSMTIEHRNELMVAINTGTNIPSILTPNGQAAFLFLLTSSLAPLVRLSYLKMVRLALPYFVTMSIVGLLAVIYLL